MRAKTPLILIAIGVLITMGIFGFLTRNKPDAVIYRLVWFELQIAPASYRFAIIPEQPILIGFEGENGEKGATMLIRYDHVPEVCEKTVERVDNLVRKNGVLELAPSNPSQAFDNAALEAPSVHVRIAYSDNRRWASAYTPENVPEQVTILIRDTKALAKQIMQEQSSQKIDGDIALQQLEPAQNASQKDSPRIIVKLKIQTSGVVLANNKEVSFPQLESVLDELKSKNAEVWYYRESPNNEPTESTVVIIKKVFDAVASRKLPIRLQEEEY